ncbi:hypothetical protein LTR91_020682 [Friedmanniomyces endolithicus]|uniref:Uncharacterized protein n=1 Tax=Friedmanniomyces endolithicus TaxID=329885 RepID=A0AAN6K3P5_9PEZI|nr:hypothetical protein LTS09_016951 [Friedmanniomyces endolithicus]KAK0337853.1 hypothetical protein LTR94_002946 [Friedmanniomyces endolithicus]KAK0779478.1 hypothetical protein LTR38_014420 [Friedmanniomyces endolithicus]KAK0780024.1 hypothetical protein LTR75_015169 [Friedmanniomyces endolithicus]KAK0790237.1 hypothetical protein LTR59_009337 [Friedmanniomyces endolithicus]
MADAPASFCQRLGGRWIREDMTTLLIRSWTTPAVRHLHDILIGSAGPRLERAVASPSCRHSRTSHVDETGLPAIAKQPQEAFKRTGVADEHLLLVQFGRSRQSGDGLIRQMQSKRMAQYHRVDIHFAQDLLDQRRNLVNRAVKVE